MPYWLLTGVPTMSSSSLGSSWPSSEASGSGSSLGQPSLSSYLSVAAAELGCRFCTATFPFEANLARHVSLFHAGAVAFDTPVALGTLAEIEGGQAPPPVADAGDGTPAHVPGENDGDVDMPNVPPAARDGGLGGSEASGECHSEDKAADADADDGAVIVRGALSAPSMRLSRVRHVFLATTSAVVHRYFLGMGDMTRAEPLVPPHRQGLPTAYVTDELKAIRMLALSTGGAGMSEKARLDFYNSVAQAEAVTAAASEKIISELEERLATSSGSSSSSTGRRQSMRSSRSSSSTSSKRSRPAKKDSLRERLREAIADAKTKAKAVKGPLTAAFPTAAAFVSSLKGEQDRCLSDMKWQVTDVVDGVPFKFFFRDIMDVAHDAFSRAEKLQLWGKRLLSADGAMLRSNSLDSDVYLTQEADVLKIHANALHKGKPIRAFAMAVQFFSDATLLSWNGGEFSVLSRCTFFWSHRWGCLSFVPPSAAACFHFHCH